MQREQIEAAFAALLRGAGLDPTSPELSGTPARATDAIEELFSGIGKDPVAALGDLIDADPATGGWVLVRDLRVRSMCEHHLLPFYGSASIAYAPRGKLAGLGRFSALVDVLSSRPQLQERLTAQIGEAIEQALTPGGVLVKLTCAHGCVRARGVREQDSTTVSIYSAGTFADPVVEASVLRALDDGGAADRAAGASAAKGTAS